MEVHPLAAMLKSRKVWLALIAVVQSIVLELTNVPLEVWGSIDALLVALILNIAWEDAAMKKSGELHIGRPVWESLYKSRKVWLAGIGAIQSVVFWLIPSFPQAIWISVNGLLIALMTSMAWEDSAYKSSL